MIFIVVVLLGATHTHAFPKTLTPGACTTKTLPIPPDKNIVQEFLKSTEGNDNGGWSYEYSSVKDAQEGLSSASLSISKTTDPKSSQGTSYTLQTLYQIKSYKINPPITDVVVEKSNKLVSTSAVKGQNGKPETEYVILKFKKQAYVYFYKCSNAPDAEKNRDARFVLTWNGELSAENKKEIEDFDRSLSEGDHKVFVNKIQEI